MVGGCALPATQLSLKSLVMRKDYGLRSSGRCHVDLGFAKSYQRWDYF
jgi:hypothetical protein